MKNEIFIHTNKGTYVGGEQIHGTVFLCIHHGIPARSLTLYLSGYEKVFWQETKTEFYDKPDGTKGTRVITIDREADHTFFKISMDLVNYPGGFPAGQFQYPFIYQLPNNLPGVFRHTGSNLKAKVEYKIKAVVDVPHGHDLHCKQHLVIHEKINRSIEPRHFIKDHKVRTLCCIPRGDIHCEAYMDKNAYQAGETAQVHVNVNNQSTVEVTNFNVKLIRELQLNTKHGHVNTLRQVIATARYPGTDPKSEKQSNCPLPLLSDGHYIQPSTNGKHVKARYEVMIECSIPWAPDLEIYAPVIMYAPQPLDWVNWQPPTWAATAQQLAPVSLGGGQVTPVSPQPYGQPQEYGQPQAYGQPQPYGQPQGYGQPESEKTHLLPQ